MIRSLKGSFLILTSALFFSLNTLIIRQLSFSVSSLTLSMIRFIVGIVAGGALLYSTGGSFRVREKKVWSVRGILGSVSMILYFQTIAVSGVAWATLLVNLASFFAALNGRIFFKKSICPLTAAGMATAFSGVVVIYYTSPEISLAGTLLGLSVAFLRGFTTHMIKKSSEKNHPAIVYLAACIFGLAFLPLSFGEWESLTLPSGLIALGAGLIVFFGQVLMTAGFKSVPVLRGVLLLYISIPLSLTMAFFLGEEFSFRFILGSLLIVGGILLDFLNKRGENVPQTPEIPQKVSS